MHLRGGSKRRLWCDTRKGVNERQNPATRVAQYLNGHRKIVKIQKRKQRAAMFLVEVCPHIYTYSAVLPRLYTSRDLGPSSPRFAARWVIGLGGLRKPSTKP